MNSSIYYVLVNIGLFIYYHTFETILILVILNLNLELAYNI